MRKQRGDYEDADNVSKKNENEFEIKPVNVEEMCGTEAFFALMGMKMMKLAKKYTKSLEEIHSMFYMVSCDFELLEQILEAQANDHM